MLPTTALLSRANTLGWIGLGAMGGPMATNLYTKAWALAGTRKCEEMPEMVICEPNDANAAAFVNNVKEQSGEAAAQRVRRVSKPSEVAKEAARVFTMLPSTPQVEAVYLGESGLLKGLGDAQSSGSLSDHIKANPWLLGASAEPAGTTTASTLLVDHTTLDPTAAKRIADDVHAQTNNSVHMIDGPVSGGVAGAKAGTLTIMFGSANETASDLARGLLQFMSREGGVVPCGGSGAGVGVKVCNNLVLAINQIGLAEGLALGHALKIDPLLLHDIFNTSSAQSWSSKVNSPLPEVAGSPGSRGYNGGFLSKLMLKDVGLALSAAHAHSLPTPLTWAASSVYEAVGKEGDGAMANQDFSVVYKWLLDKQAQGVEVGWKNGGPGDKK